MAPVNQQVTQQPTLDRRKLLLAGLATSIAAAPSAAQPSLPPGGPGRPGIDPVDPDRPDLEHAQRVPRRAAQRVLPTLVPDARADQTAALQAAIDDATMRAVPLELPGGVFIAGNLTLHRGTVIVGARGLTQLIFNGSGEFLVGRGANGAQLVGLTLDGGMRQLTTALVTFDDSVDISIQDLTIRRSSQNGIALTRCKGSITGSTITTIAKAAIFGLDSTMRVQSNAISDCWNNGILIWRSEARDDGSQVLDNRIVSIRADAGGSGQNGNGINVFRAGGVQVSGNRIADCAYSAVRGNAASNLIVTSNTCQRIGEVALYAEFGFTGALIANNLVDGAACGVSVTNFNEGGRLAVVQGNLIRNIFRRETEPQDKRGEGIAVEADTLVSANTIENAATCGIILGWGRHMRDVTATGNLIRGCKTGVLISADASAGSAIVTQNLISTAPDGAIRAHDAGRAFGPDLAKAAPTSGRVTITANAVS